MFKGVLAQQCLKKLTQYSSKYVTNIPPERQLSPVNYHFITRPATSHIPGYIHRITFDVVMLHVPHSQVVERFKAALDNVENIRTDRLERNTSNSMQFKKVLVRFQTVLDRT